MPVPAGAVQLTEILFVLGVVVGVAGAAGGVWAEAWSATIRTQSTAHASSAAHLIAA